MSSDELNRLQKRKTNVNQDIGNARERISAAEDKIERLQEASTALDTSIQSLRSVREAIESFEVTKAKWEGDQEQQFESTYNSYGVVIGIYDIDAGNAKQQIDEDLELAKQDKAQALIGLGIMQFRLAGLESDIKAAKEDS